MEYVIGYVCDTFRKANIHDLNPDSLIALAERSYPESKIPVLFGPSSLSAAFAEEADDPSWSSAMEGRILDEVARQYANGLRYKRAQVECRTLTCVLLLSYVTAEKGAETGPLPDSLRQAGGFRSVIKSQKHIPVQTVDPESRMTRTEFVTGYLEMVFRAAR